ncbi:MAG: DPP IV N-terminal domain-containing protein, partial [Acidobacteriota bacterium]
MLEGRSATGFQPKLRQLAAIAFSSIATISAAADDTSQPHQNSSPGVDAEAVSLELIMSDSDWIGNAPNNPYWADDSSAIYFEQKREGEERNDLIRLDLATGEQTTVIDADRGRVDVGESHLSPDRSHKVYTRRGDVYVKRLADGVITQLTRTAAEEIEARFMADGSSVTFQRDGQVFVRSLETGLEWQADDVRLTEDPVEKENEAGKDFLGAQQLRLFDIVKQRKQRRESQREHETREQTEDTTRPDLPFYLGDGVEISAQALSPAGDALLLVVADAERNRGREDKMADWVTEDGYVKAHDVRPKVGTGDGLDQRLLYLDLEAHEVHELDLSVLPGFSEDPLAELRELARKAKQAAKQDDGETDEAASDAAEGDEAQEEAPPHQRQANLETPPVWSPDGTRLAVQIHSYDNKDRWLALVDPDTYALEPIHRLSHEAWINWSFNEFGWLSDSRRLYFLSEESGYSQLYLYDLEDRSTRRLTTGDAVVSDVVVGPEEEYFYFTANPDHPGIYETYRVAIEGEGTAAEQLTDFGGRSAFVLSPDGQSLLIRHSSTTRPPELSVVAARPDAEPRQLTDTASERFRALPWVAPEIVGVPSSHHDRPIYSRYYPPQGPAPASGRPAVVFVHGAGYLQNAHYGWSGYFREFMFHTFLSQQGYAVLDMDYRASAGYGAAWRTAIYRQMGTPELEDLQDGVAWLIAEHGIDPQRVGVYGGFMTMMALFKDPDLFAAGAALRPVTDWAHYNHPYTSNILNTPDID